MVPIKIKIKDFENKNYRTLFWQLSLEIKKIQGHKVLAMKVISLKSLDSIL